MICCPDLFPRFWIACNTNILSLRIVADLACVPVDLRRCKAILLIRLIAYKILSSLALCTNYRSIGPT
jgi:hypothetical protein